jgi:NADH dehydrogenase
MRRPHLGGDVRMIGDVGQIQLVQANVRYPESIARALDGADGVVNCVGILSERGAQNFRAVHVAGAAAVAEAAKAAGIARFVQVSALGAASAARSRYARTKAQAEAAVRAAVVDAVIVRPSIVFGQEDSFFNRFADMARFSPVLPLIGGGKTRFQPAYVGDVAEAIANALDRADARGRVFELGGPRIYTFRELMLFLRREIDRRPALAPLPFFLAQPLGIVLSWAFALNPFMDAPLTGDQVVMLKDDNVVSAGAAGFGELGVTSLETIETIAPSYLVRFRPHGQFEPRRP